MIDRIELISGDITQLKVEQVGAAHHIEWWVPAGELEELNKNIVGKIEVIGEYKKALTFFR